MRFSFWDILTVLLILATLVVGIFLINVYNDPGSVAFLRTPTLPGIVVLPTKTNTPFVLPPTWTATPPVEVTLAPTQTLPPTATGFVMDTFTATATQTPTPTNTRTPTSTPTPDQQATIDSLRATVWFEQTATARVQITP